MSLSTEIIARIKIGKPLDWLFRWLSPHLVEEASFPELLVEPLRKLLQLFLNCINSEVLHY